MKAPVLGISIAPTTEVLSHGGQLSDEPGHCGGRRTRRPGAGAVVPWCRLGQLGALGGYEKNKKNPTKSRGMKPTNHSCPWPCQGMSAANTVVENGGRVVLLVESSDFIVNSSKNSSKNYHIRHFLLMARFFLGKAPIFGQLHSATCQVLPGRSES